MEEFIKSKYDEGSETYIKTKVYVPNEIIYLPCDCGCGIIGFSMWPDGDSYILYYSMDFSNRQRSFFNILKEKIKFIWYIIRGKEYRLFEVTITPDKLEELSVKIQNYLKKRDK